MQLIKNLDSEIQSISTLLYRMKILRSRAQEALEEFNKEELEDLDIALTYYIEDTVPDKDQPDTWPDLQDKIKKRILFLNWEEESLLYQNAVIETDPITKVTTIRPSEDPIPSERDEEDHNEPRPQAREADKAESSVNLNKLLCLS